MDNPAIANLAETLAEVLPEAVLLKEFNEQSLHIAHYSVPKGWDVKELKVDLEHLLPNPRRTKAMASFADTESFLAYVQRHADERAMVWCDFNPQTFALKFKAVFDEHAKGVAGWRAHSATYEPAMSTEWKDWKGGDKKSQGQMEFAQWIEEHEDDITAREGMPNSLQMHEMATNFVMNEDRVLKSSVRMQSGGVRLTYVADADKGTTEDMKLFEKFAIGIPVFHGGSPWSITARLRYRNNSGKLSFHYELIRADRVHDAAAKELVGKVREGLGTVPLLMGVAA